MYSLEDIKQLVELNSSYLQTEDSVPIVVVAKEKWITNGIARGLNRYENLVALTGNTTEDGVLKEDIAQLIYAIGAVIVCSDIDTSILETIRPKDFVYPEISTLDIHLDTNAFKSKIRKFMLQKHLYDREKALEEGLAFLIENRNLDVQIQEMVQGNHLSVEEINKRLIDFYDTLLKTNNCEIMGGNQ